MPIGPTKLDAYIAKPNGADGLDSLVDAKNKVPEYQRYYQAAYKAHTRLWQIVGLTRPRTWCLDVY